MVASFFIAFRLLPLESCCPGATSRPEDDAPIAVTRARGGEEEGGGGTFRDEAFEVEEEDTVTEAKAGGGGDGEPEPDVPRILAPGCGRWEFSSEEGCGDCPPPSAP